MEIPEVYKCFGMFPLRYGCLLISFLGLGCGGVGLAGLILYGVIEDSIVAHFVQSTKVDESLKKAVLVTIGLTSLLLVVGNLLLFLGVSFSARGCVQGFGWITFAICLMLMLAAGGAPVSCFFLDKTCLIKKISSSAMVLAYLAVTVFLQIWLYFMVVAFNFKEEL